MCETVKNMSVLLVASSISAAFMSPVSLAADLAQFPAFSPDIHLAHSNAVVPDEESAYPSGSLLMLINLGTLPVAADVDAIHGLSNGDVLFSLETSIELDGTLYRPSDIIRFNGTGWSKEFDGLAEGIPSGVNIDAIAQSGETLLFSVDVDAVIGSVTVNDADVIAFSGTDFTVFLSAVSSGIDAVSDIDALHVDSKGRILVSFDSGGFLDGISYRDEDMLAWSSSTWSLEFDGSADDTAWQPADLDAWSIVFIDDIVFSDGFE